MRLDKKDTHMGILRAALLAAALVASAAACGDDDTATSDTTVGGAGSATTTNDAPALSGEPVVLGYINQEEGSSSTFPDQREGTEAAVDLVNEQGGIGGRPLELLTCATNGSPEASQGCANRMVEAGVALVQGGIDYGGPASIPILSAAGIPYVPTLPILPEDFTHEGVFTFFGGSAGQFAAQVRYVLEDLQAERVGVLVINVPAGTSAAEALVKAPLEAEGVDVNVVPADANTTDFTPSLTAILGEDPDVIMVMFTGPPCGQIMQASGALGIDVPMTYPSGCIDQEYLDAGGTGADGAIFSVETVVPSLHQDDPDVELYVDAMDRFAGKSVDDLTTYNQVAFSTTYNLAQLLGAVEGDITSASVTQALQSADNAPNLMSSPYTCDGSALPGFPTICNAAIRFVQREGDSFIELTDSWLT